MGSSSLIDPNSVSKNWDYKQPPFLPSLYMGSGYMYYNSQICTASALSTEPLKRVQLVKPLADF